MSEKKGISKNGLMLIGVISVLITLIGIILIALGYNEALYLNFTLVQAIFTVITNLGDAIVLILVITIFYIVYDKKFAKNLALSLMFSIYVNEFVKELVKDPRPPANIDYQKEYGVKEASYGFPSGHTQSAVAVWGYIGYEFKDKPKRLVVPILMSIIIFLIAISRVILGVHDLQDVVGGYVLGIIILMLFIHLEPIVTPKFNELNLILRILIVVIVSVSLFVLGTLLFPKAGLGLAKNAPLYSDEGSFSVVGGALLGLGVGYLIENKYVNYQPSELKISQKLINLAIGIILLLFSYYFIGLIIHGNVFFRFVRFALVGFVLTFVAPFIFTKINRKGS